MNKKLTLTMVCLAAAALARGEAKDNFLQQQAYAEMQRVTGQVDVLQNNLGDLQRRVGALEGGGDAKGLRQEIDALKAAVADIRRELQEQRTQIVNDLTKRISKIQAPAPAPAPTKVVLGPHQEYTVQSGDTLSLIAQAFNTTVAKLKEMNGLKGDNLRIGQKLAVPK